MKSLTAKIHNIRLLALAVVKTGKITGGINAAFASYPDVWAALQPELKNEGLSVGFHSATLEPFPDGEKVRMEMVVGDGTESLATGFEMLVPEKILNSRGSSVTNNAQRVANAQSYLKRTALIHYFGMSAGNEDEVERMMPVGDQSNIPGLIRVTDATVWQDLTDGLWGKVESPLHDGTLTPYSASGAQMAGLWDEFPNHPGIVAWAADWIGDNLQHLGLSWADVMELDPTLPGSMTACDGPSMRLASKAVLELRRKARAEGGAA
ncbi:MAG: hypothetical protein V4726_07200 [Verrucomicrobiota bacterium]